MPTLGHTEKQNSRHITPKEMGWVNEATETSEVLAAVFYYIEMKMIGI